VPSKFQFEQSPIKTCVFHSSRAGRISATFAATSSLLE